MTWFGTIDAHLSVSRLGGDAGCRMDPVPGDGIGSMLNSFTPPLLRQLQQWVPANNPMSSSGFCAGGKLHFANGTDVIREWVLLEPRYPRAPVSRQERWLGKSEQGG